MKIVIFKILLFLFSFTIISSSTLESVNYSNYNTSSSLINYLTNNKTFFSHNSLFFQFAFYIPLEQSKKILGSMASVYEFSGLYGIILILDKNSNITNITIYSNEVLDNFEKNFNYTKKNTYIIILQYDPSEKDKDYENNLYINVGGKKAENYLNETSREELIAKWKEVLKEYNYDNFSRFYGDVIIKIFLNRDNDVEESTEISGASIIAVIIMFIVIILIVGTVVGVIFYAKKRYDIKSNLNGEINTNSNLF